VDYITFWKSNFASLSSKILFQAIAHKVRLLSFLKTAPLMFMFHQGKKIDTGLLMPEGSAC
jgi:hypothetical protein